METGKFILLILVTCTTTGFLTFVTLRIRDLITDKDYYGFPAVTKCRVCNKTVWEWQGHERRVFTPVVNGNVNDGVSGSGIVHKKCKGHPEFEVEITVK